MRDSNSGLKRSGLILELTLAGFKLGIEVGRIPALIEVTELIPDLAVELGGIKFQSLNCSDGIQSLNGRGRNYSWN